MMRTAFYAALGCAVSAQAQLVLFEGDQLPEHVDWRRRPVLFPSDRWNDVGWFVQQTAALSEPPYEPEQDIYDRSIADFSASSAFFVEWRILTDGPRAGIPSGAPAGLTASGTSGVFYHFTLAADQIRLVNSQLDAILFEIEPGTAHTIRLEVRDTNYRVLIDGQQAYGGTTPIRYPTSDSVIVFWARALGEVATTRWDYIRYGVIPDAEPADVNCDGLINLFDVDPFILAMFDPAAYATTYPNCDPSLADVNRNGVIEFFDIDPFVDCVLGACP